MQWVNPKFHNTSDVFVCVSWHISKHKHRWLYLALLFHSILQNLQVFLDGVSVATLESLMLCYPDRMTVQLNVTPTDIQISANSADGVFMKSDILQKALELLNTAMQNPLSTYIGGIPGQSKYLVKLSMIRCQCSSLVIIISTWKTISPIFNKTASPDAKNLNVISSHMCCNSVTSVLLLLTAMPACWLTVLAYWS